MGYYIQAPTNKQKAQYLIGVHDAKVVGYDSDAPKWSETEAIICVIDNGAFEAAGYAFSPEELHEFARQDNRDRVWLTMDKTTAQELSGYKRT